MLKPKISSLETHNSEIESALFFVCDVFEGWVRGWRFGQRDVGVEGSGFVDTGFGVRNPKPLLNPL